MILTCRAEEPEPSEFIPKPDIETADVSKVYTREAIIPQDEYSSISINEFIRAKDDDAARLNALPYRRSRWLEAKLRYFMRSAGDKRKENLCVHPFRRVQDLIAWPGRGLTHG